MIIPVFILTAFWKCKVQKYRLIGTNSITTMFAIVITGQILDYKLRYMYTHKKDIWTRVLITVLLTMKNYNHVNHL